MAVFEIQLIQGTDETLTITFLDQTGTAKDITNDTITGKLTLHDGTAQAIDGTLALVTPSSGIFSWVPGTNDKTIAEGLYAVQFLATDDTSSAVIASFPNMRLVVIGNFAD